MPTSKKSGGTKKTTVVRARANAPANETGIEIDSTEFVEPGTTGRFLILMREDSVKAGVRAVTDATGLSVASAADYADLGMDSSALELEQAVVFEDLGVAVVNTPPEQIQALSAAAADDNPILAIEPERINYTLQEDWPETGETVPPVPARPSELATNPIEYLRGYRDAVNHLVGKLLAAGGAAEEVTGEGLIAALNEAELTWGLQVTKAATSRFSGQGIRVAVLDTGLDLGHPDFVGRRIVSQSFIPGQTVQDGHGHGTHCIGTACGPRRPGRLPRYGVAFDAEIFAGKVLSNQGSGPDGSILAGIQWAITNRCQIVSMSLGSRVLPGQTFSPIYEQVAQRALAAGTLIIAAAGNDSNRPGSISPVSRPANSPSIMAVAALDPQLRVARFSNAGINPQGGQVDIAGPGVDVISTWPRPRLYNTISGTSMATPHVAGIAALLAQANPGARGRALASLLSQRARRLTLPARDVGAGLVQAP